ncbi:Plancitoxin-1, partial [Trichinella nativa]
SVTGTHQNKHFFAYNNAAAGVVGVKTKSNSKGFGVIILDTTDAADAAAWIVHTVPGYPVPKVQYTFPASEYANGHLLICLTIAESQIEPIAAALFMASPFIHYNDIPETEVKTRPTLRKLLNGETAVMPPFTTKQNIGTQAVPSVPVQIFSKSGRSKYEIYQKIISKQLKKTIKVWSRRDKKLKANCKIPGRHILLVSSPISVDNQASSLEKDSTSLMRMNQPLPFVFNKRIFLHASILLLPKWIPALKFNLFKAASLMLCIFQFCSAQTSKCQVAAGNGEADWAILYKPPGDKAGKILVPAGGAWAPNPRDLENVREHSFAKALESVAQNHPAKSFFAYNNAAPGVIGIKTKSNSKGVVILDNTAPEDSAAWIVHTVPGYPKPKVAYTFPASEYANGHLLLCLTIAESQIEPIAVALFVAAPFIYYNDVPDAEVNTRPTLKKLLNGETAIKPPFLTKQNIVTQGAPAIPVQVFSKSERSKYEIYQKIISKQLKKTIKVWSRRDKKLKANCKIPGRHILLVSSPISVDNQASSLEKDVTNWLIPENGDIFCAWNSDYPNTTFGGPSDNQIFRLSDIFNFLIYVLIEAFIAVILNQARNNKHSAHHATLFFFSSLKLHKRLLTRSIIFF